MLGWEERIEQREIKCVVVVFVNCSNPSIDRNDVRNRNSVSMMCASVLERVPGLDSAEGLDTTAPD